MVLFQNENFGVEDEFIEIMELENVFQGIENFDQKLIEDEKLNILSGHCFLNNSTIQSTQKINELTQCEETTKNVQIVDIVGNIKLKKDDKINKYIIKSSFSHLNHEEKTKKMKHLAREIRFNRRKIKSLQIKLNKFCEKSFIKYYKTCFSRRKMKNRIENDLTITNIIKALKKLKNSNIIEISNDRNLIENLVIKISNGEIPIDSIQLKMISTQIRLFIEHPILLKRKNANDNKLNYWDRKLFISSLERKRFDSYFNDEIVMRHILGIVNNPYNTEYSFIGFQKTIIQGEEYDSNQDSIDIFNKIFKKAEKNNYKEINSTKKIRILTDIINNRYL